MEVLKNASLIYDVQDKEPNIRTGLQMENIL